MSDKPELTYGQIADFQLRLADKAIAELRAEVERLTAERDLAQEYGRTIYASAERYQAERDELLAECDQWQKKVADLWVEIEALRESVAWNTEQRAIQNREVERLVLEFPKKLAPIAQENTDLRTENERLRAAHAELVAAVGDVMGTIDPILCSPEYKRLWDAYEPFDKDKN